MQKSLLGAALFGSLFLAGFGRAQTFELGQPSKQDQQKPKADKKGNKQPSSGTSSAAGGMGWGSSIEVGRNARAAEDALKKGNYAAAMNFAERMTVSAPNEARNWFLLGYTARLAGKYQASVDAYNRGLGKQPNSVEGLSGLAQTFMHMGKAEEAKRLLLQVIAANPRRPTDLAMAGELFMKSGDLARASALLERSEALQPSVHAEVLLAVNYMKQKQPEKAKQILDRAMKRGPGSTDVLRAVAQFHREAHDYDEAIAILQKIPRKSAEVESELGYTYELAGKKKEAADTYEKAAAMAPQSVTTQLAAAQAQLRIGELDKTRTYLARAEQLDPNHYRLHATRGDLAAVERRDTDAVQEYLAALAAIPEGPAEGVLYPTQLRLDLIDAYRNLDDQAAIQQQLAKAQQELAAIQMEGQQRVEYLRLRAAIRGLSDDFPGAETDLKEAMALDPTNDKVQLQYGSLLWKTGRKQEAGQVYTSLLERDANNRYALEAMGYLARDAGDNQAAETFFNRMAEAYPNDYVPYVALGDLYTAVRDFAKAEDNYEKAYKLAPSNSQIIADGSNAAIDAHQIDLAGEWVERASGAMKNDPRIIRETERYLFLKGKYAESARLGEQAIQKLPHDRDAAVYLGYDYYNLGRYDEVLALVSRYETVLPKEPNFPLLAGHVHRQNDLLQQAIDDFTRAIQKDPRMVEAMVNRGYVRNDMQDAQAAIRDFQPAIKISPDNGIAHLGLAYSHLQLHESREALEETDRAEQLMGEMGATHMARATAYRQMRVLNKAENEYRLALKFAPDDLKIYEALADTLYHAHRYPQAIIELNTALRLSLDDPLIYANLAAAHAQLHQRAETMQYIEAAEREAPDQSAILLATGDALMTLGEQAAAMERFTRALDAPDAHRVDVRLEFAKLFVRQGKYDSAKQQVALAFAESRVGESSPITTDNLVEAANVFVATHDFDLAERYFSKAKDMGASDDTVAIGLADTYIAQGKEREAAEVLSALGNPPDYQQNYDYEIAWGNVYNQRHDNVHAVTAFAHANDIAAADDTAERAMLQVAGEEGTQVLPSLSMQNGVATAPIFVDATIYELDNKLIGAPTAPPPYASQATGVGSIFRYHHPGWPPINAFFGLENYNGSFSLPNEPAIIQRNTFDTLFNFGVTPVVRIGNTHIVLNPGIQFDIRRDTESPVQMNQNLFRTYLYMNTSPLFRWLTVRGTGIYEAGPFTEQNLHSRELVANLEFEVGRPWGNTSFITGYYVRDLLFRPAIREFFSTATWGGLQRRFHDTWSVTVLATYVRSWRVQDNEFAIAQILVPGARFQYKFSNRWTLDAAFYYTHGEGFNIYNNVQTGFFISYMKPLRRRYNDGTGEIAVDYPLSLSFGLQQQSFYNFPGSAGTYNLRPVVKVSFF
ncbi:MAG TPA: tetratricopeptide repeat protein [Candidatus Angelobacter sp.]